MSEIVSIRRPKGLAARLAMLAPGSSAPRQSKLFAVSCSRIAPRLVAGVP
jgi:hypothetical protein